ncbi:hypothetical protein C8A05DRAFT_33163 [Staphylotrichum tortipilum]|uniref:Thioester reductase (TE) domain-containing protein n=1 Tax=Staphylotrichum tortipilum TaxID=2831512 RepID=A0AAN6RV11_9PEZI|nr:hypothetical protein C8A05DRAFT_33163 [Staphylotrichum longicolle]
MASDATRPEAILADFLRQVHFPPRPKLRPPASSNQPPTPWTVILVGSTGFLGTYLLSTLNALPPSRLRRVHCLDRSPEASSRATAALHSGNHPPLDVRFTFHQVHFDRPTLGLDAPTQHLLTTTATIIIHNAWPVSFALPLASFLPHLTAVRDLLALAHRSPLPTAPLVLFISSLGVGYESNTIPVPESLIPTARVFAIPPSVLDGADTRATAAGYAQSKHIAEFMLATYARSTGSPAAVIRPGQLAGPVLEGVEGPAWPVRQWFPTLLRASKVMGVIPDELGAYEREYWMPGDLAGRVVLEVAESVLEGYEKGGGGGGEMPIFNLANPHQGRFGDLVPLFRRVVAARTVPIEEWVRMLVERAEREPKMPGARLVEYYKRLFVGERENIAIDTDKLVAASRTARVGSRAVDQEWMAKWLKQWGMMEGEGAKGGKGEVKAKL